jgi:predicted lactoylglutathione lyase
MQRAVAKQIFVNLPVKDLKRSIDFFTALGFTFNPQFTDDNATCMIIGENIYAMLLVESFFKTFTKKQISEASKATEVLTAISVESWEKVDEIANRALASGGSFNKDPQDHGWMYSRSFQDPDGHIWELLYMDESKIPTSPPA